MPSPLASPRLQQRPQSASQQPYGQQTGVSNSLDTSPRRVKLADADPQTRSVSPRVARLQGEGALEDGAASTSARGPSGDGAQTRYSRAGSIVADRWVVGGGWLSNDHSTADVVQHGKKAFGASMSITATSSPSCARQASACVYAARSSVMHTWHSTLHAQPPVFHAHTA